MEKKGEGKGAAVTHLSSSRTKTLTNDGGEDEDELNPLLPSPSHSRHLPHPLLHPPLNSSSLLSLSHFLVSSSLRSPSFLPLSRLSRLSSSLTPLQQISLFSFLCHFILHSHLHNLLNSLLSSFIPFFSSSSPLNIPSLSPSFTIQLLPSLHFSLSIPFPPSLILHFLFRVLSHFSLYSIIHFLPAFILLLILSYFSSSLPPFNYFSLFWPVFVSR